MSRSSFGPDASRRRFEAQQRKKSKQAGKDLVALLSIAFLIVFFPLKWLFSGIRKLIIRRKEKKEQKRIQKMINKDIKKRKRQEHLEQVGEMAVRGWEHFRK